MKKTFSSYALPIPLDILHFSIDFILLTVPSDIDTNFVSDIVDGGTVNGEEDRDRNTIGLHLKEINDLERFITFGFISKTSILELSGSFLH